MSFAAQIIDQQVRAVLDQQSDALIERFGAGDRHKLLSAAFLLRVLAVVCEIADEDAFDVITDGGDDLGIDALIIGDPLDGELPITVLQSKYTEKDTEPHFPENDLRRTLEAVRLILNTASEFRANQHICTKVAEIRAFLRDDMLIPSVRVVFCNNGQKWSDAAEHNFVKPFEDSGHGKIEHVNHETLLRLLKQKETPVTGALRLTGEAFVEDFPHLRRVLIGKITLTEVKRLFDLFGERLLDQNIRRYLGTQGSRINQSIAETIKNAEKRDNFYFYNNGITAICKQFRYDSYQKQDIPVQFENLQIINGGQTCRTIQDVLSQENIETPQSHVLMRIYELAEDDPLVQDITFATNSQNPVDMRDLHSNDPIQKNLALSLEQLGYSYRPKRGEQARQTENSSLLISSSVAAEAVLAVWRKKPHVAKFRSREMFGKYYDIIFSKDLNGAQVVLAVLIFRYAENKRKRPDSHVEQPVYAPYASLFVAMLMGRYLLEDRDNMPLEQVTHKNFIAFQETFEKNAAHYHKRAFQDIDKALEATYVESNNISLWRYAATFRRSDLIEKLEKQS
jgi:hypothetical protein